MSLYTRICSLYHFLSTSNIPIRCIHINFDIDIQDDKLLADEILRTAPRVEMARSLTVLMLHIWMCKTMLGACTWLGSSRTGREKGREKTKTSCQIWNRL